MPPIPFFDSDHGENGVNNAYSGGVVNERATSSQQLQQKPDESGSGESNGEGSVSSGSSDTAEDGDAATDAARAASATYLHPNSAAGKQAQCPEKKKRYSHGVNVLTRLVRRGPRKKAGCAYEKRLSLEIKAAKTVAIVTGCFIFCWLGFAILYGLSSFAIESNEVVWSVVFWLGYLNSALNPVIYTVFNREFRTCFKRLLTCNHLIFGANRANREIIQTAMVGG